MSVLVILRLVMSTVLLLVALAGHGAFAFRPLALQNADVRSTEGGCGGREEEEETKRVRREGDRRRRLVQSSELTKTRLMNN